MLTRCTLAVFLALASCLCVFPAMAGDAAQDALSFAERKNWNDAAARAARSGNPALVKLVRWMEYKDPDSTPSLGDIRGFLRSNPDWPDRRVLIRRAEAALLAAHAGPQELGAWFAEFPPVSETGKLLYLRNETAPTEKDKIEAIVRDAWINGDFDAKREAGILKDYGKLLSTQDHIERISRLLWEEKTAAALRILSRVPQDYQKLFNARVAFIRDLHNAGTYYTQIPPALRNDVGILYQRLVWRFRRGFDSGVEELLQRAPAAVPYPEKWWRIRERYVRRALENHNVAYAKKLLRNHGQTEGGSFAEAMWLSGWFSLEWDKNAPEAYKYFYALFNAVKYPVSKSRGAYWAGRAAEKNGNADIAVNWYKEAGKYPTTFYGQLALLKLSPHASLRLPLMRSLGAEERNKYKTRELARVVMLLVEAGKEDLAKKFIGQMIDVSSSPREAALIASLGNDIGRPDIGVKAAKRAMQKDNTILLESGYPLRKTSPDNPLEKALALAITRQESEFHRRAVSPSGAIGMMQLLKSTAKETARKNDFSFSPDRLYDADYNIRLGSAYLARLIKAYEGSYIQAIAAYNAGPGNVRNWRQEFGPPPSSLEGTINWIEKIPFEETRNYVQRVLENLQIYRYLLNKNAQIRLAEDLMR